MEVREPSAKYLAKAAFKQTAVGAISDDWDVVRAAEVCSKIQDGTHFSPRPGGWDYLYVTSKNIKFGFLDLTDVERIDAVQHRDIYRRCDVKQGDLLLTKDGANTGNAALNSLHEEFSLLSSVAFLRFTPGEYEAAYFLQQILSPSVQKQIQDAMSGNAITRLTLEKIRKLSFPCPPTRAEQQAIATALSDADALIESLEQLLTKKRQIKQGAMQELLTAKRRLPGFEGEWEMKRLGDLAVIKDGTHQTPKYVEVGVPFYSVENVTSNDFENTKFITEEEHSFLTRVLKVEKNDILMTRIGSIGDCKLIDWDVDASFYVSLALLKVHGAVPAYIAQYSNSAAFRKEVELHSLQTAIPKKINLGPISEIKIQLPSTEEQAAIATILSDMDADISVLEAKLSKARAIKQGMMQELLTGRIRLVEKEAA